MGIVNKMDLAKYMIAKYKKEYSDRMTPIKLQKGMYFLYAFWGGKIRSQKLISENDEIDVMTEMDLSSYDENLFDADFEAWAYGPVDRSIYIWYKELEDADFDAIDQTDLEVDDYVKSYTNDLMNRIFNSNDFGLVDLSHEDKCWREVYNPNNKNKMDNETILQEYAGQY